MQFEKGNQYWRNRKTHNHAGTLTTEQYKKIHEHVAKGGNAIDFIFDYVPEKRERIEWYRLKADCYFRELNKLQPDLTAEVGNEWIKKYDERAEQFIARRAGGLQVITGTEQANGTTGSV